MTGILDDWMKKLAVKKAAEWITKTIREKKMLNFLTGYKTYITGAAMIILGGLAIAGIMIPGFPIVDGAALIMQGLGLIFLRKAVK